MSDKSADTDKSGFANRKNFWISVAIGAVLIACVLRMILPEQPHFPLKPAGFFHKNMTITVVDGDIASDSRYSDPDIYCVSAEISLTNHENRPLYFSDHYLGVDVSEKFTGMTKDSCSGVDQAEWKPENVKVIPAHSTLSLSLKSYPFFAKVGEKILCQITVSTLTSNQTSQIPSDLLAEFPEAEPAPTDADSKSFTVTAGIE